MNLQAGGRGFWFVEQAEQMDDGNFGSRVVACGDGADLDVAQAPARVSHEQLKRRWCRAGRVKPGVNVTTGLADMIAIRSDAAEQPVAGSSKHLFGRIAEQLLLRRIPVDNALRIIDGKH